MCCSASNFFFTFPKLLLFANIAEPPRGAGVPISPWSLPIMWREFIFVVFALSQIIWKRKTCCQKRFITFLKVVEVERRKGLLYSKVLLKIRSKPHCNFFGEKEFRRAVFHCWRTDWNGASSWQCSTRSSTALIG